MHKNDVKLGIFIFLVVFMVVALVNSIYLWLPASVPPVLLVVGIGLYSIWEHKYGNKA
jgi:hypothetical protein